MPCNFVRMLDIVYEKLKRESDALRGIFPSERTHFAFLQALRWGYFMLINSGIKLLKARFQDL